ncbi:hypothetical protein Pse7367_1255 [Thalassoporum mexicanum PCC 7367]|uniref:DUF4342 domain-containing protein n=1 Tax=Thalassoporum mexicanum TaxID=3457544 RepID=UPI00029FFFFC|nr:DUF4342 domain-containing protein [Pseudanabaena sp. PCC 7367]AFY69549.1 hypothetical protein Pse7367_1255 [Pseudanabaena sp. PCC 7367]
MSNPEDKFGNSNPEDRSAEPQDQTQTQQQTQVDNDEGVKADTRVEEFTVSGSDLVDKVKELLHQGNIRRIIIKNDEGNVLLEIPMTVGVAVGAIGVTMFPILAALGAIGALVVKLTLVIERKE